jgi:hypothetical protein
MVRHERTPPVEAFILFLLLGWLAVCTVLTMTVTFVRQRRTRRVVVTPISSYSADAAPIAPALANAQMDS